MTERFLPVKREPLDCPKCGRCQPCPVHDPDVKAFVPVEYVFEIEGPLYAYRRLRDKGGYDKYCAYKKRVLLLAMRTGFRRVTAKIPKKGVIAHPVRLVVTVAWKKRPRMDLSNVVKGIEDAIFAQDRWVAEIDAKSYPDKGQEVCRVEVRIL